MDIDAAIAFVEEREGKKTSSTESSAGGSPSAPPRTTHSLDSSGGGYSTVREYEAGELLSAVAYDERGGVSADELVDLVEVVGKMFTECHDHYPIGSVSIMYHSERRGSSNLCQYKVSGKEFCYKPGIKRMLETRINVELQNSQFDKSSKEGRTLRIG